MNLYNQKNILHVIVGKNETYVAENVLIDAYGDLNDGNVAIIDSDNLVRDTDAGAALTGNEVLRFVTRVGNQLIYSPQFKPNDIVSMKSKGYSAATQQVSYIGYVGSGTGNIEAIDNNEYIVRVLLETSILSKNKQMYKFGAYKSGNAATSAEVAIGLVDNLTFNFKREPISTIVFATICNVAVDAAYDFTQTFTAVQGENFITTGDLAYNTAAGTLAVGDYIRVADDALNGTLALTDPVYEVIKITGTTKVWLDRPWTNASGSWTDAGDGAQVIPAATGLAATWGIKCTGVAPSNFKAGVFDGTIVRFKLEPSNCGDTAVTYTTAAAEGYGTYVQISELEWFAQGNLGLKYRVDTPPVTLHTQAAAASTYETITMKYKIRPGSQDSITGTTPDSYGEIILAFVVNSDCGDKIFATLDEWATSGATGLGALTAW